MSTVSLMTSLMTEDCSKFLPPQHRMLDQPSTLCKSCEFTKSCIG